MTRSRYNGPRMTLGNMRENGVRRLTAFCNAAPRCWHQAEVDVDRYPDTLPIVALEPCMVCTRCGMVGAHLRPNWSERPQQESLTGQQWARSQAP